MTKSGGICGECSRDDSHLRIDVGTEAEVEELFLSVRDMDAGDWNRGRLIVLCDVGQNDWHPWAQVSGVGIEVGIGIWTEVEVGKQSL